MTTLMRLLFLTMFVAVTSTAAPAQIVAPQVPSTLPPPPPPSAPPPPRIDVPPVPKMDGPPPAPKALPQRSSFNDRVIDCLTSDYATRLSPGERAVYSRACANTMD